MGQINVSREELHSTCAKAMKLEQGFRGNLQAHEQHIEGTFANLNDAKLSRMYGELNANMKSDVQAFCQKLEDIKSYVTRLVELLAEYEGI
ncbi:MAG: hypothetical protein FWD49_05465 [Firmicutes bacterium]|nr:hypothetical protein [Bacillota bacterium]